MDICLTKTLSNLLNKSSGSQAPAEHAVKNAEINITISNKDAVLTFTKDRKSIMKIPIEDLLQELGLKATEENILILRKIITNKIPITTNKFEAISRLLVETAYKEELLDFLFSPYLRLILTREDQQEKTSLYFKTKDNNQVFEFTILYQHPKTDDILVKIIWGEIPVINMFFKNQGVRDFFQAKLEDLRKNLQSNISINLHTRKELASETKKPTYYKIDLKV